MNTKKKKLGLKLNLNMDHIDENNKNENTNKDIPNNNKPDENPPKINYFNPASVEYSEFLLYVAKTYRQRLCISIVK